MLCLHDGVGFCGIRIGVMDTVGSWGGVGFESRGGFQGGVGFNRMG